MITIRVEYAVEVGRPESPGSQPWLFEHGDDLDGALARIREFTGSHFTAALLRRTVTTTDYGPTDPTLFPHPPEGPELKIEPTTTLAEAKEWIKEQARANGAHCPACTQFVKVYRRKLNSGMARSLIKMWRAAGQEWQYIPETVGGRSREEGKLAAWGLIEDSRHRREDGGKAGVWRVTDLGAQFVRRAATVQKYALMFDARCLGLVGSQVSIVDVLGDRFSYDELMGTHADGTTGVR
jgi:hypothetical protein